MSKLNMDLRLNQILFDNDLNKIIEILKDTMHPEPVVLYNLLDFHERIIRAKVMEEARTKPGPIDSKQLAKNLKKEELEMMGYNKD